MTLESTIRKMNIKEIDLDELIESLDEKLDEKVQFEAPTKDGNTFQVIDRDTKGMRGKQDKFKMQIVDKRGKVIKDLGSHPSLNGAKGMAKNRGIIEEVELDERSAAAQAKKDARGEFDDKPEKDDDVALSLIHI